MEEKIAIHPNKLKGIRVVDFDMTTKEIADDLNWAKSTYNRYERSPDKIPLGRAVEIFNYIREKIDRPIKFEDIFFS